MGESDQGHVFCFHWKYADNSIQGPSSWQCDFVKSLLPLVMWIIK